MAKWNKKEISPELVREIHERYHCDLLTASILVRRGITKPGDIKFFLERNQLCLHNPFLYEDMTDAVSRIKDAEEEHEKVLIFGDRDVDGITSTTLLYQELKSRGMDVSFRLPTGNEAYGLSMEAVDTFAAEYGSLIITVDCGISNNAEIAHAAELGIDVIVVDHHNPQAELPEPAILINPKIEGSGYPFQHLSGCAVVFKLVTALRFADTAFYGQEVVLLNVHPLNDAYQIDCIKIANLIITERFSEVYVPGLISISQTKLLPFLQGQQIYVWDEVTQKKMLQKIFGTNVDFNLGDLQPEIEKTLSCITGKSLLRLISQSHMACYREEPMQEIDLFFQLFVNYARKKALNATYMTQFVADFQLVALAAIADIMPLIDENRILVNSGIAAMNKGGLRPGLLELFSRAKLLGKPISSTDLSWTINPILNAAGRLGEPETVLKLLTSEDPKERDKLAVRLLELNEKRKALGSDAMTIATDSARKSLDEYSGKLVLVADERIDRGVTGITATKLSQHFHVPAVVITFPDDNTAVGSVRSVRGYDVTDMLEQSNDLYLNHGGHNYAAGFSLPREKLETFKERLRAYSQVIEFTEGEEEIFEIDAELPQKYLTPDILNLIDRFEPYGEENPQLTFYSQKMKLVAADLIGKDKKHLKLTFQYGAYKWPALYWNAADKLKTEFEEGDMLDVLYQINRNVFNGNVTPQLIIMDMHRSQN